MKRKICKGNFYDSRMEGGSNSKRETGYDVCITEEDGNQYFYQLRDCGYEIVKPIEPVEIINAEDLPWEDVSKEIRKEHFFTLYPKGSKRDMNKFVFGEKKTTGEEKTSELSLDNEWAEAHLVYDITTTIQLAKEFGRFENVKEDRNFRKKIGGCKHYCYIIDNKWYVTVTAGSIIIEMYAEKLKQYKAYGKRVNKIAKKAKVPWKVASFLGDIESEEEVVSILERVKRVRGTIDEKLQKELSGGLLKRRKALEEILGEDWKKFNCTGKDDTTILANYLLGKMVG